jgi:hypothetical protein
MPFFLNIKDNKGLSKLIILEKDCSLAEIKERVATALGFEAADLLAVDLEIPPAKKVQITEHTKLLSLRDCNLRDGATLRVNVTISPNKVALLQQTNKTAQEALKKALSDAETASAHVIISVGSFYNEDHGDGSLERQQYPLDRLGGDEHITHIILIDPQFNLERRPRTPGQYYELNDWVKTSGDTNSIVSTYKHRESGNLITTIAAPIISDAEMNAYFREGKGTCNILGFNLLPAMLRASKEGRGLIAGNFYDEEASDVVSVAPDPNRLALTLAAHGDEQGDTPAPA